MSVINYENQCKLYWASCVLNYARFLGFLSKKYLRQISILGTTE